MLTKVLQARDVRNRMCGYGPDGASVQAQQHGSFTDRDVVRATVLSGKPKVPMKEACDRIRAKVEGGKRKALSQTTWQKVMQEAVKICPVLRLQGQGHSTQLVLQAIPDAPQAKVDYHNALMTVCGVTLRALVDSMEKTIKKRATTDKIKKGKGKGKGGTRDTSRSRSPRGLDQS